MPYAKKDIIATDWRQMPRWDQTRDHSHLHPCLLLWNASLAWPHWLSPGSGSGLAMLHIPLPLLQHSAFPTFIYSSLHNLFSLIPSQPFLLEITRLASRGSQIAAGTYTSGTGLQPTQSWHWHSARKSHPSPEVASVKTFYRVVFGFRPVLNDTEAAHVSTAAGRSSWPIIRTFHLFQVLQPPEVKIYF